MRLGSTQIPPWPKQDNFASSMLTLCPHGVLPAVCINNASINNECNDVIASWPDVVNGIVVVYLLTYLGSGHEIFRVGVDFFVQEVFITFYDQLNPFIVVTKKIL